MRDDEKGRISPHSSIGKGNKTMCGRFVGYRSLEQLKDYFPIDRAAYEVIENYNIAPSQEILAIATRDNENWLDRYHWGLVPFWAKDVSIGNRMINARAESVATKPSFRNAFRKRRCLIPADGFFEWKKAKGQKQPMLIKLPDDIPFAFAGLWDTWHRKEDAESIYRSCTIITTEASECLRHIHHRMPVILKPETYGAWLDPGNQDDVGLKDILTGGFHTDFVIYPVSKKVNAVRHNSPSNIKPIQAEIDF
jgi:putative SOS response-associated peptidase YedK